MAKAAAAVKPFIFTDDLSLKWNLGIQKVIEVVGMRIKGKSSATLVTLWDVAAPSNTTGPVPLSSFSPLLTCSRRRREKPKSTSERAELSFAVLLKKALVINWQYLDLSYKAKALYFITNTARLYWSVLPLLHFATFLTICLSNYKSMMKLVCKAPIGTSSCPAHSILNKDGRMRTLNRWRAPIDCKRKINYCSW